MRNNAAQCLGQTKPNQTKTTNYVWMMGRKGKALRPTSAKTDFMQKWACTSRPIHPQRFQEGTQPAQLILKVHNWKTPHRGPRLPNFQTEIKMAIIIQKIYADVLCCKWRINKNFIVYSVSPIPVLCKVIKWSLLL